MARGWESKSIESQQEEAGRPRGPAKPALTTAQRVALDRRRGLEMARARAQADLQWARSAAHREMLTQMLASIDQQLQGMENGG